jgi:hypothetical protein
VEPVAELFERAHTVRSTILYIGMRRDIHSTQPYNQYNNSYEPYTENIFKTSATSVLYCGACQNLAATGNSEKHLSERATVLLLKI